jgi:DNA modification methylase
MLEHPADLIFADPPYNYGVRYADDPTRDALDQSEYFLWCNSVVFQLKNLLRPNGTLWWLCPAEYGQEMWTIMAQAGLLLYGKPIIWYERFSQYQQKRLTSDYRLLFALCWDDSYCFNPNDIREKSVRQEMGDSRADPRGRVPGHVWTVRRLQGTATARVDWHPAQLAPEPLERIVKGWTRPGETVLDAFAGSGNMGQICRALGRNFIGVDRSATYCRAIEERLTDGK